MKRYCVVCDSELPENSPYNKAACGLAGKVGTCSYKHYQAKKTQQYKEERQKLCKKRDTLVDDWCMYY
jgi:hypothetical protein